MEEEVIIPSRIQLDNPTFVTKIETDPQISEFLMSKLFNGQSNYNQEDEKTLLKYLKTDAKNVVQYVQSIEDKNIDDLTLLDYLAFKIYGHKFLHKYGIERYEINVNKLSNTNVKGDHDDKSHVINIYKNPREITSVYEILKTLHHECFHAIQTYNCENLLFDNDEDINVYIKDKFLRQRIGDKYYQDNYFCISYEYDSEYKSVVFTDKLFDTIDKTFEENKEFIENELSESREYIDVNMVKDKVGEYGYWFRNRRVFDGRGYSLNALYDSEAKKYMQDIANNIHSGIISLEEGREKMKKENILLYYDSYIKPNDNGSYNFWWRKGILDLINDIEGCVDEKEKDIYYKLIEHKITRNEGYLYFEEDKMFNSFTKEFDSIVFNNSHPNIDSQIIKRLKIIADTVIKHNQDRNLIKAESVKKMG